MQRERKAVWDSGKNWRRVVGSCLACLYILSAAPVAPAFIALLGSADRSHHMALQQTASGIQIVLRHDCANFFTHRHGAVARALTLLAQRPVAGQPDHVIQFGLSAIADRTLTVATVSGDKRVSKILLSSDFVRSFGIATAESKANPRPPPRETGSLSSVCSVVLLI